MMLPQCCTGLSAIVELLVQSGLSCLGDSKYPGSEGIIEQGLLRLESFCLFCSSFCWSLALNLDILCENLILQTVLHIIVISR